MQTFFTFLLNKLVWENCSYSEWVKFITDQSNVQHVNITINTIKNELIKM
jgi:hypothetical protein